MTIDNAKAETLKTFSKAFNTNDISGTKACTTEDFQWIFYEGADAPYGHIYSGAEDACAAVVTREKRSLRKIEFSEVEEFQSGDKVFTLYRATGEFRDTGPFDVRAIDVYSFTQNRISCKDTYWKIVR